MSIYCCQYGESGVSFLFLAMVRGATESTRSTNYGTTKGSIPGSKIPQLRILALDLELDPESDFFVPS
jgi:hypothetical protein